MFLRGEAWHFGREASRVPYPTLQIPHYYSQFAFSLGKESPYIFGKFNPLNSDTFYSALSVPVNRVWVNLQSSELVIDE